MIRRLLLGLGLSLLLGASFGTTVALACVINNQSSLSANGYVALKNLNYSPSSHGQVPFIFSRVYGGGQTIRFSENLTDLRKSLNTRQLSKPFLWRWGDGTYSIGRIASHTYRHTGTYVVLVYTNPSLLGEGVSYPFDRAQIQVVPASEVWRDNLSQDALDLFGFAMRWGGRTVLVAVFALVGWGFFEDWRHRTRKRAKVNASGKPVAGQ